jgi:hypothetical protein
MELELEEDEVLVNAPSVEKEEEEKPIQPNKPRKRPREPEPEEKGKKSLRTGEMGGRENTSSIKEEKSGVTTVRELLWNRKEHLVSFLRKTLPPKAHHYAQMVQETEIEEWVKQFQTYVIPFYRLGLMRVVIQRIMDKVNIRMEDLGRDAQEAKENYQHFTNYMNTFARLIQSLSSL